MDPATIAMLANAAAQTANAAFGDKGGPQKIQTLSRGQKQQQKRMGRSLSESGQLGSAYGGALDLLKQYINPNSAMFGTLAAPYMRQFQEQTIPGLSEQFAGAGALGGGLSSSGFGQALGAAGGGLQERLAALQAQIQQQAVQGILGQYNQVSNQYQNTPEFAYVNPTGGGAVSSGLSGFAQGGGFDQIGNVFGSKAASPSAPNFNFGSSGNQNLLNAAQNFQS
jgi:hypothetical protein